MTIDTTELQKRLEKLAYKKTIAFCYGCYVQAPLGKCVRCGSDDLMRELAGEGVEYGVDWVIRSLLSGELTSVNVEEAFEQSMRECYPETTQVGWLEVDTVDVLKEMDPVSWRCARSDWESSKESDGQIISCTYYRTDEVESYLDENESEEDCA
jgi:hypothetical protein